MILFIAPNPHKIKEREGFLQRVAAIDEIFLNEEKVYSDDLPTKKALALAMIEADMIYVHSIYNANKILRCYREFSHKIVTDLHGVVPEEEAYADNQEMVRVMTATEAEVFRRGKHFVAVTHAMVEHFKHKYPSRKNLNWTVLPIYMGPNLTTYDSRNKQLNSVVYAGGGQRWQNTELMVDAIKKLRDKYSFTILTHSIDAFDALNENDQVDVEIKTVPSRQVAKYYEKAALGFVLRNDTVVNNVACPTKLIEYLSYGVVPIVLSEKIGDFIDLGYKYIKYEDFINQDISIPTFSKLAQENFEVYKNFLTQITTGKNNLIKLRRSLKKFEVPDVRSYVMLLEERMISQEQANTILRYEYQLEEYQKKIGEYADLADHYKHKLHKAHTTYGALDSLRHVRTKFKRKRA